MKQQATWLVYCLSFVYEAVFKFNYYSKLNSNWHQETSLYMTKLKKENLEIPTLGFSLSKLIYIGKKLLKINSNYRKLLSIYGVPLHAPKAFIYQKTLILFLVVTTLKKSLENQQKLFECLLMVGGWLSF